MGQERGVRRHDRDDRPGPRHPGALDGPGHLVEPHILPDGDAVHLQAVPATVIGLHEHADHGAAGFGNHPRGGADAAFEVMADHAGASSNVALGDRASRRGVERRVRVAGLHVHAADVVEHAVPRLRDDRKAPIARRRPVAFGVRPDERVPDDADAVRVREPDGGREHARLANPREPRHLAVAVQSMRSREDRRFADLIARDDDGDAGPDRPRADREGPIALDQRRVSNPDAVDVGDGVLRAGGASPIETPSSLARIARFLPGPRGWAKASGRGGDAAQGRMMTGVPRRNSGRRRSSVRGETRTHPALAELPIEEGSSVPWIAS
jgi:hypothetical protein